MDQCLQSLGRIQAIRKFPAAQHGIRRCQLFHAGQLIRDSSTDRLDALRECGFDIAEPCIPLAIGSATATSLAPRETGRRRSVLLFNESAFLGNQAGIGRAVPLGIELQVS